MSALTVDAIVAKFPNKTLPKIKEEPNYENINESVQLLYANAATLATTLGGGAHGHIGIIMQQPLYATLTATPYIEPAEPTVLPVYPPNTTAATREIIRAKHKEEQRIFSNHNNMDDALKAQLVDAINDPTSVKCAASIPDTWASRPEI